MGCRFQAFRVRRGAGAQPCGRWSQVCVRAREGQGAGILGFVSGHESVWLAAAAADLSFPCANSGACTGGGAAKPCICSQRPSGRAAAAWQVLWRGGKWPRSVFLQTVRRRRGRAGLPPGCSIGTGWKAGKRIRVPEHRACAPRVRAARAPLRAPHPAAGGCSKRQLGREKVRFDAQHALQDAAALGHVGGPGVRQGRVLCVFEMGGGGGVL